jgi:hypothetical protein
VDVPYAAVLIGEDGPVAGAPGRMGYAWMDRPTDDGTTDPTYNNSSAGGLITSIIGTRARTP